MSIQNTNVFEYATPAPNPSSGTRRSTKINQRPAYKRHVKPPYSYVEMIGMAIKASPSGMLTLRDIINYMYEKFECFRGSYVGWKNSVRHNLSSSECFSKVLRDKTRPYGKDNYWTWNENCQHCKNNFENEAACQRIFPTTRRSRSFACNRSINNNFPINFVIEARSTSPASSECTSDVFDEANDTEIYGNRPYQSSNMYNTNQRSPLSADVPTPTSDYFNYDQYQYGGYQHRQHHRYHPYTPPHAASYRQHGRYQPPQGPTYMDDLATLEDLYVPATDIDLSMYNVGDGTHGKLPLPQPFTKEQPHGLYTTMLFPSSYDLSNYQHYALPNLPTPYQYSPEHYERQDVVSPPMNRSSINYHPYSCSFAATKDDHSFPSSPSSCSSSISSDSDEDDSDSVDSSLYVPTEALSVIYDKS